METDRPKEFLTGEYQALESRGITKETCEFWQYQVGFYNDQPCHIANYRDSKGVLTHQQLRLPGKEFKTFGGGSPPMYGAWLWRGGGKFLTITTGLLDALSVSQAFDNKYPVYSLPNGDGSAEKAIAKNYAELDQFETIVLMFDQDESGQKAAELAASLLPPGKVKIASLGRKDPSDVLRLDGPGALVKAFWNAKTWRPDGIIEGTELTLETLKQAVSAGYPLPYPELQRMVLGLRKGELTLLTAGSGIGKSTWAREQAFYLNQEHGLTIGNVFLEENNAKTAQAYVALYHNVPLGQLRHRPDMLTNEQWQEAVTKVVHRGMWFYNHFGSLESSNLLSKLRYLAVVCKVDFIVLDHISIVTSGVESSSEGERKDIDILMTRLRQLVEETGVGVIAIVHLKRSQGKVFNEGSQISLSDLRGSAALEQLSDNVYAMERDQQSEDAKDTSLVRVLKCRETGDTGAADQLVYNRATGRLQLPRVTEEDLRL